MVRQVQRPDDIGALLDRLERLERIVAAQDIARRAGSTAVETGGKLTVRGALVAEDIDGSPLLFVGQDSIPGVPASDQAFMLMARANGDAYFRMYGASADSQYWAWYDQAGNIVFGDDATSGQGLARPYLPLPWRDPVTAGRSTTSGTGEVMFSLTFLKQHPYVWVLPLLACSDGTTAGTVTLRARDGSIIDTQPIPAGSNAGIGLRGQAPGSHLSTVAMDLVVTRTAGAGSIRVDMLAAYGMQS